MFMLGPRGVAGVSRSLFPPLADCSEHSTNYPCSLPARNWCGSAGSRQFSKSSAASFDEDSRGRGIGSGQDPPEIKSAFGPRSQPRRMAHTVCFSPQPKTTQWRWAFPESTNTPPHPHINAAPGGRPCAYIPLFSRHLDQCRAEPAGRKTAPPSWIGQGRSSRP